MAVPPAEEEKLEPGGGRCDLASWRKGLDALAVEGKTEGFLWFKVRAEGAVWTKGAEGKNQSRWSGAGAGSESRDILGTE